MALMTLTAKQREALRDLQIAIEGATNCGLFDVLAADIHPDTINTFCDAVNELEKE